MKNIQVTVYTKKRGRIDLNLEELNNFNFKTVIYHRIDGPAIIWYNQDGSVECEYYHVNNKRHRLDGPAQIWYHEDGSVKDGFYYINNKEYKKEDYDNLINEMKALPKSLRLVHELWWVREL